MASPARGCPPGGGRDFTEEEGFFLSLVLFDEAGDAAPGAPRGPEGVYHTPLGADGLGAGARPGWQRRVSHKEPLYAAATSSFREEKALCLDVRPMIASDSSAFC